MLRYLVIILFSSQLLSAQTNEGTDFWLTFLEHVDLRSAQHVIMVTSRYNTSGTIEIAGLGYDEPFNVSANDITLITIPATAQIIGSETIEDLGIQVRSEAPVSVYIHQYSMWRSDATLVLPIDALGSRYYILAYQGTGRNQNRGVSEFAFVSTEDETEVTYFLTDDTQAGESAGSSVTVLLNQGETYQVRSVSSNSDLSGSFIQSNKPIAVFAGASWTSIPANCPLSDNILEQMPPVESWGNEFISAPTLTGQNDFDVFRVLSATDNNEVVIETKDGPFLNINLDEGEFYEFQSGEACHITADQPVLIAQYLVGSECTSNTEGDPSLLILNSIQQIRDTVIIYNSSLQQINENYVSIICLTEDKDFIELDGDVVLGWQEIADYSYATPRVTNGSHIITSTGCGVIVTAFGLGEWESYAYGGGASFAKINASPLPDGGCFGLPVVFETELSPDRYELTWDIGDGVPPTNETMFEHTFSDLGTYPAQVIIYDKCFNESDTVHKDLLITLRQQVEVGGDQTVCNGDPIILEAIDTGIDVPATGQLHYEWNGPMEFFEETDLTEIILPNAGSSMAGTYEVKAIVSGCATFPESIEVQVNELPVPDLGPDEIICTQENDFGITLSPGEFYAYEWQDNSNQATLDVEDEGTFSVAVYDEIGCEGIDTIQFVEQCPTAIYTPNIMILNDDRNGNFQVLGTDIISASLSIYDRWGTLVFRSNELNIGWNGRIDGSPAEQGVYTYLIDFEGYDDQNMVISETLAGSILLLH